MDATTLPAPTKPVGAVVATVQILRHLTQAAQPLRLSQIARALSLNNSTCFNILRTLHSEGLITFDRQSRLYGPGDGLVELAAPLLGHEQSLRRFRSTLDTMARDVGATLALWQRVGDEVELLSVAEPPETMRIAFTVGRRTPLALGAMGRLIAARSGLDDDTLRSYYDKVRWANPPGFERWLREVTQARERAYGIDLGNVNRGILGLAVPVETSGPLRRVCCASLFDIDHDAAKLSLLIDALRALARLARAFD